MVTEFPQIGNKCLIKNVLFIENYFTFPFSVPTMRVKSSEEGKKFCVFVKCLINNPSVLPAYNQKIR